MWNLKIEFDRLDQASDFINKARHIKKVEFHIEKTHNQIVLNGNSEYSRELILEALSNAIVVNYKTKYFDNSLNVSFLPQQHRDALIKALVLFDVESDIFYVLNAIENYQTINIESFDKFILSKIKHKWQEFAFITNMNGNYLLNYDVFIEFLKFLISSIQPKTNVINLKSDLTKYLIFDDKNNIIDCMVDLQDEMGLITNLVLLAPQNINIHCADKMSEQTFKTLYYLFDKKINLLV